MKMSQQIIAFVLTLFLLLTGCNSPLYNQTEDNVADVKLRADDSLRASNNAAKPTAALVVNQGLYVDKTPIDLAKQPNWLKNRIVLRGDQLPFTYYSRTVVGNTSKVLTHYQVGLDENQKISMNYSGTVKGALDLLASKTGYVYSVRGNDVYWQAFVTKTFEVAFMPGSSDYMMGKASGGNSNNGTTGASGTTSVTASVDDSASAQYSNFKGTLSIWKDLDTTIKQLLSANGTVIISEATTTVTVRDRPANVNLVSRYIANLNNNLSRQVLVKVQVLEVTLNSDFNFGINWNAVKQTLGNSFFLNADYGTPVSITPLTGANVPTLGVNQGGPNGSSSVSAIINALSQQGKVSVVTEPRVVCLNNQVSVIRIINQEGYLASIQNTTVSGTAGSGSTVTSQLTPGSLITGLTLYILPKLLGNRVYLQVNADLANKVALTSFSSATGTATGTSTPAVPNSIIQLPSLTQKQFNQRSVIASGDSLILSGYRQVTNQTGAMQLLQSQALGGKASAQTVVETIVLITPIILHGLA